MKKVNVDFYPSFPRTLKLLQSIKKMGSTVDTFLLFTINKDVYLHYEDRVEDATYQVTVGKVEDGEFTARLNANTTTKDILKLMKDLESVMLEGVVLEDSIEFAAGGRTLSVSTDKYSGYPMDILSGTLTDQVFSSPMNLAAATKGMLYVDPPINRTNLRGVYFESDGNRGTTMVITEGIILVTTTVPNTDFHKDSFLVPFGPLKAFILEGDGATFTVCAGHNKYYAFAGDTVVEWKAKGGMYPDYKKLTHSPNSVSLTFVAERKKLLKEIKFVSSGARTTLFVEGTSVNITGGEGGASSSVPAIVTGGSLEVEVLTSTIMRILKGMSSAKVEITLHGSLEPFTVKGGIYKAMAMTW